MDKAPYKQKIRALAPLDSLSTNHFDLLFAKLNVSTAKLGETLFVQRTSDKNHVYLLDGKVELSNGNQVVAVVSSGTEQALHPIAHSQPRQLTAKVVSRQAVFLKIPSDMLDIMLTWDQTGDYDVDELTIDDTQEDWMMIILQSKAFRNIPPANIQSIFMRLEEIKVRKGEIIFKQDTPGDYFFILKSGHCMVTRLLPKRPGAIKLAELGPGEIFGEEALISDTPRNGTVTMLTDGSLMRLSKKDFVELMQEPMLNRVTYAQGKQLSERSPTVWMDVRLPNEFNRQHITGSINLPLVFLRMKKQHLDKGKNYIVYCDTGGRSSAAAFLLVMDGFKVYVLEDGIGSIPQENVEQSVA
jgi:CRP-like cAMP-binding protein